MPLSPAWSVQKGTDAAQAAVVFGIEDIDFTFQSLRGDSAKFKIPVQAADADPAFPFGTQLQIFEGDTRVFLGTLQTSPAAALLPRGEALSYAFEGPWWFLESTIFQQSWAAYNTGTGVLGTRWSSRLVLCQALDGTYITTGAQIREVLTYAIACGAPFQIGTIPAGVLAPTREVTDCSCAEVIRNMLRWTPDVAAWFDYSTNPLPTLHMKRRADLTAVTLPMVSAISESLQITARNDIQVPVVVLKYNQPLLQDSNIYNVPTVDRYPVDGSEQAPKAIIQTLDLQSKQATKLEQPVVTGQIPALDDSAATIIAWWQKRDPFLAKINVDDLGVVAGSYGGSLTPDQTDLNGDYLPAWTMDDLPHELKSGTITQWMVQTFPNLKSASMDYGVRFYFKGWLTNYSDEDARNISRAFAINAGADTFPGAGYPQTSYEKGVTLLATNATTFIYSKVTEPGWNEAVPAGLAQNFYEALNALHYEGSFAMVEEEISRVVGLGNTLNLSGGRAEWATMAAQVQSVNWTAGTGSTTVNFGPPEHLAPQDVLEFIRGLRRGDPSTSNAARVDGTQSAGNTIIGAGHTAHNDTKPTPTGMTLRPYPWYGCDSSSGSAKKFSMFLGRVNRLAPTGLSSETFWEQPVTASGEAWAACTIDQNSGECTAWVPGNGVVTPDSTATTLYVKLLTYTVTGNAITIEPIQTTNINFARREIVVNGALYWEFFFTFETDPIAVPTS